MAIQRTPITSPTGIGTGSAYADKDAMGTTAFSFPVPAEGIIITGTYYDLDDEGLQVDLWLFDEQPSAQTDNSAFTLTDADLQKVIGVIEFTNAKDAVNGQVMQSNGLNIAYKAKSQLVYAQLQARGALNIASSNLPAFALSILG